VHDASLRFATLRYATQIYVYIQIKLTETIFCLDLTQIAEISKINFQNYRN